MFNLFNLIYRQFVTKIRYKNPLQRFARKIDLLQFRFNMISNQLTTFSVVDVQHENSSRLL